MAYVPSIPFADFDFPTVSSQEVLTSTVTTLNPAGTITFTDTVVVSPVLFGGEAVPFSHPVGG